MPRTIEATTLTAITSILSTFSSPFSHKHRGVSARSVVQGSRRWQVQPGISKYLMLTVYSKHEVLGLCTSTCMYPYMYVMQNVHASTHIIIVTSGTMANWTYHDRTTYAHRHACTHEWMHTHTSRHINTYTLHICTINHMPAAFDQYTWCR